MTHTLQRKQQKAHAFQAWDECLYYLSNKVNKNFYDLEVNRLKGNKNLSSIAI